MYISVTEIKQFHFCEATIQGYFPSTKDIRLQSLTPYNKLNNHNIVIDQIQINVPNLGQSQL